MSDPVRLLAFVLASAVAALVLLALAPGFLLLYGFPLGWAWMSVLLAWIFVDGLHGYFEDQQRSRPRETFVEPVTWAVGGVTYSSRVEVIFDNDIPSLISDVEAMR